MGILGSLNMVCFLLWGLLCWGSASDVNASSVAARAFGRMGAQTKPLQRI